MKKPIKKLSLYKMTISNLNASEMHQKLGGLEKPKPKSKADCSVTILKTICVCAPSKGAECTFGNTLCCPIKL